MVSTDAVFAGSIPALYDRYLGPLLFEPYANDLAARAAALAPTTILETAAGTGIVTRALKAVLPDAQLTATDLNQAMLDVAAETIAGVAYQQADAQALPFEDASFHLIVCQFGAMFFPDRVLAYREARRVLRPGGVLLFNVWDRISANPVSAVVSETVAKRFPHDPPGFLDRVPFGYGDTNLVKTDLGAAGFNEIEVETVVKRSRRPAREAAEGLCKGSPLRAEIESRDSKGLDATVDAVTEALAKFGGRDWVEMPMSAHVFTARR